MNTKIKEITPQDRKIIAIGCAAAVISLLSDNGWVDGTCALGVVWTGVALLVQFAAHRKRAQAAPPPHGGTDEQDGEHQEQEQTAAAGSVV